MAKILINASNVHVGGGVQVASSFISELRYIGFPDLDISVVVSNEVYKNINESVGSHDLFFDIEVIDSFGVSGWFSSLNKDISKYDLVFTIFGPNYLREKGYLNLVGFAQPWIIDGSCYHLLSPLERLKSKLKFFIQKIIFSRSDALIVELESVRDGLCREEIAKPEDIFIAHNCISSVYLDESCWQPFDLKELSDAFRIGFVGRDYPHKNLNILPEVKDVLLRKYSLNVDFFVTLNDHEWKNRESDFKINIRNVGPLLVTQCPSFYSAVDGVIFPSLLECFSATPLEALTMKKPLFSSDRKFVKDVCGEFAYYFDPLDPSDVARIIAEYITEQHGRNGSFLADAREHAINFSSAKDRAERYIEIIRTLVHNCNTGLR